MGERDWKEQPPTNIEEAFQLAEHLAEKACEKMEALLGERPRHERRGMSVVIVWPDGEETNQIEVAYAQ